METGPVFCREGERSSDGVDRTDGSIRFRQVAGTLRQDAMTIARSFASASSVRVLGPVLLVLSAALTACETPRSNLQTVPDVAAPYSAVLAVAPFTNESGVSISSRDILEVSDKIVASLNETTGINGSSDGGWRAVPVDRTLSAMRQLGIEVIRTEAEARAVIETIPVDGLILGTITEWSPYDPPAFAANVLLLGHDDRLRSGFDAAQLYGQTGDEQSSETDQETSGVTPVVDLILELDAVNHRVRTAVRTYAESHSDVTGGFDPPERYYLMVYDRYLDFVANQVVRGLIARERATIRVGS